MKTTVHILALACFTVVGLSFSYAQELSIQGGNQVLSISTALPGSEPAAVINTSATLNYKRQSVLAKITVRTVCPGQHFTLKVLATSVNGGTAAPEVTLTNGMTDVNVITDIPKTGPPNKSSTLQYTASATFAQGNSTELGNDIHSITYTLVAQ